MNCKKCGADIAENQEYCEACLGEESQKTSRRRSFWDEVEKNQTTIEEFGYKVTTEIRRSDNTVVYIASNDAEETVAIKKITVPYGPSGKAMTEEEVAEKIRTEMETLSKISSGLGNRFVITYYDYKLVESADKWKYDLYIRMDYLSSIGRLYSEGGFTVRNLLTMGSEICDALDWCHKNGRVHNNLNLNNIFINDAGRYVLGDFASFANAQNEVEYCIAPEMFYGDEPSVSTDIYSLGMVMFVLLNNGLPPFAESEDPENVAFAVQRLRNGEIPSPAFAVNHRLSDLIRKAISPKGERFVSVAEMKTAMDFLLTSMPEEWLEQDVRNVGFSKTDTNAAHDEDAKVSKKEHVRDKREKKTTAKPLAPEEVALKKKNRKDFWLIGIVITVLIAAIVMGTLVLYNGGNRKIYSLIESESYAVAFKEISVLKDKGQNVDDLLKTYITACADDAQYKRVVQALPLFSDEAYGDTTYFLDLYSDALHSGKEKQAEAIYMYLYEQAGLQEELETLAEQ